MTIRYLYFIEIDMINYRKFLELEKSDLSKFLMASGNPKVWKERMLNCPAKSVSAEVSSLLGIIGIPSPGHLINTIVKKPYLHGAIIPAFNLDCNWLVFCSGDSKKVVVIDIKKDGSVKRIGVARISSPLNIEYEVQRIIDGFPLII